VRAAVRRVVRRRAEWLVVGRFGAGFRAADDLAVDELPAFVEVAFFAGGFACAVRAPEATSSRLPAVANSTSDKGNEKTTRKLRITPDGIASRTVPSTLASRLERCRQGARFSRPLTVDLHAGRIQFVTIVLSRLNRQLAKGLLIDAGRSLGTPALNHFLADLDANSPAFPLAIPAHLRTVCFSHVITSSPQL
jgi:hypothetical protein